jgi:competence protein ComEC
MRTGAILAAIGLGLAPPFTTAAAPWVWSADEARAGGAVTRIRDSAATGGQARRLQPGQSLTWQIEAPQAGRYELHLRYRTADRAVAGELRVNGRRLGLGLPAAFGAWRESPRTVTLQKGRNEVAVAATKAGFDLDELRVATHGRGVLHPLEETPAVSPAQATFDPLAPHDVRLFVRRAGNGAPAVRVAGQAVPAAWSESPDVDDAGWLTLPAKALEGRDAAAIALEFPRGPRLEVPLAAPPPADRTLLMVATLDVRHGKCTVLRLPDGTTALIDTGTAEEFAGTVAPFLRAHGLTRIEHVLITHYHDDHSGGLEHLRVEFAVGSVRDYRSFRTGDTFDLGGVSARVLNAYEAGTEENSRSLSLRLEHRGFVFTDGADIYGHNQERILRETPEAVRAHVYSGNHHFHGSLDVAYLRRTDPVLFLVSADPSVYARGAYSDEFVPEVEAHLRARGGRLRETLLTSEVGHILLRVEDGERWSYETRPKDAGPFAGFGPAGG